jgi:hypothetical protein
MDIGIAPQEQLTKSSGICSSIRHDAGPELSRG